ncbi:oligopeptide transporter, OPT family [Gemmatirosa kalamazoonensis]|uniref:Oligopeptide transporter, OPT family n=1 Tax=Gemmatirosa kalamazoonensis TaxID=861299 RepID=W0RBM3_9BACT|nr:oligopeptide transporter, OPT family [Gemmatirosa kalamazoonensis]AHG88509.1 oligopeptide transporter, OPT family [Gemmatirosa kalamazoonensis]
MRPRELTARGLILGALITTVFTAANVYLGLKVGLTFASSIPAAVMSMAILSAVKDSSILENNIVQTVASAAGTLSAIIFVLPGLVIVGWWTQFPFWQSFLICLSGGVLGVLFTIPLRRALVTTSDLPYPEGVAAAEVLKVGSGTRGETKDDTGEAREGLVAVILGSVASSGLAVLTGTRVLAGELNGFFRLGATASTGYNIAWSLALLGAGHLVGLSVGMAMLVGQIISWVIAVPVLTSMHAPEAGQSLAAYTTAIWRTQVRFIGAGTIAVAAIYTLGRLARPVVGGLVSTLRASRATETGDDSDRDLSPPWILALTAGCLVVAAYLAYTFVRATVLAPSAVPLTLIAVPFVLVAGFLIAGVCGYMAGLIGASNSPISGVGILSIVLCASVLVLAVTPTDTTRLPLVAFALFVTAIVFACATISNDNLQDLKTGQLVGASPMRQQIALIVGVAAGAAVIPSVLNLLAKAYGFAGAANVGVVAPNPLPAPQATLISALAQGVIGGHLEWTMIGIGALVGVALIAIDAALGAAGKLRIPPLAVGIGIYLPMSATFAVIIGAVLAHWYDGRVRSAPNPERAERLGTLVASGLIVGESLWGVINAGLIVGLSKDAPIGIVPEDFALAPWLGALGFVGAVVWLYGWMLRRARAA